MAKMTSVEEVLVQMKVKKILSYLKVKSPPEEKPE
jgi:hypothetical protein